MDSQEIQLHYSESQPESVLGVSSDSIVSLDEEDEVVVVPAETKEAVPEITLDASNRTPSPVKGQVRILQGNKRKINWFSSTYFCCFDFSDRGMARGPRALLKQSQWIRPRILAQERHTTKSNALLLLEFMRSSVILQ